MYFLVKLAKTVKITQNTAFWGGEGRELYTGQYLCLEYFATVAWISNRRNRK